VDTSFEVLEMRRLELLTPYMRNLVCVRWRMGKIG
jgi:hypothetical protein